MKPKPKMSGWGGRKFLRPRTIKDPVGRYSPVGAVLDTCRHVRVRVCLHQFECVHARVLVRAWQVLACGCGLGHLQACACACACVHKSGMWRTAGTPNVFVAVDQVVMHAAHTGGG